MREIGLLENRLKCLYRCMLTFLSWCRHWIIRSMFGTHAKKSVYTVFFYLGWTHYRVLLSGQDSERPKTIYWNYTKIKTEPLIFENEWKKIFHVLALHTYINTNITSRLWSQEGWAKHTTCYIYDLRSLLTILCWKISYI